VRAFPALLTIALAFARPVAGQQIHLQERVEVSRVVMDVRIVDDKGDPLPGLGPDDLGVRVDGTPVSIESVKWVAGTTPYAEGLAPAEAEAAGVPAAPAGRLVVFFFQKDMSSQSRMNGLLRMKQEAVKLLGSLRDEDRVAVLSFDTHLKLWLDFTNDRKRLKTVIESSILFEGEPPERHLAAPSLSAQFDFDAARDAATPEAGLLVIARALRPLPGTKSIALFGWGLGRLDGDSVHLAAEYEEARRVLAAARAVVFSLDITEADYHTLEIGLRQVADDTGGFYVKTDLFPGIAMAKLERALAGYYTLTFERPDLPHGTHTVKVEMTHRKGTVLTTGNYSD
jgi:VWFA-related protein